MARVEREIKFTAVEWSFDYLKVASEITLLQRYYIIIILLYINGKCTAS